MCRLPVVFLWFILGKCHGHGVKDWGDVPKYIGAAIGNVLMWAGVGGVKSSG